MAPHNAEKLAAEYKTVVRMRRVRMAYLIVAFPLSAGSLLTGDVVFIASTVFFLVAALISASMATSREQQLRSLLSEADHHESN